MWSEVRVRKMENHMENEDNTEIRIAEWSA